MVVSYNGRCFDVPFIEAALGFRMPRAHVDLRFVLRKLGYRGGLKGCERTLGFTRPGLEDVDGYFAVLLWGEYRRSGSPAALETLLAYNVEDVLTLERLAVVAYNMNIAATPFEASNRLPQPATPRNPFRADQGLIGRIRRRVGYLR